MRTPRGPSFTTISAPAMGPTRPASASVPKTTSGRSRAARSPHRSTPEPRTAAAAGGDQPGPAAQRGHPGGHVGGLAAGPDRGAHRGIGLLRYRAGQPDDHVEVGVAEHADDPAAAALVVPHATSGRVTGLPVN